MHLFGLSMISLIFQLGRKYISFKICIHESYFFTTEKGVNHFFNNRVYCGRGKYSKLASIATGQEAASRRRVDRLQRLTQLEYAITLWAVQAKEIKRVCCANGLVSLQWPQWTQWMWLLLPWKSQRARGNSVVGVAASKPLNEEFTIFRGRPSSIFISFPIAKANW